MKLKFLVEYYFTSDMSRHIHKQKVVATDQDAAKHLVEQDVVNKTGQQIFVSAVYTKK